MPYTDEMAGRAAPSLHPLRALPSSMPHDQPLCASAELRVVAEGELQSTVPEINDAKTVNDEMESGDYAAMESGDYEEAGSGSAQPISDSRAGAVLIDRSSGRPVEVASLDTTVLDGRLVERSSGNVLQTRPVLHEVFMSEGPLALLNMSSEQLRTVKMIRLAPSSAPDDEEHFEIAGFKILSGTAPLERVVLMRSSSGEDIVLVRSANGTRSMSLVERAEWLHFVREVHSDPHAGSISLGSLVVRHVFPEEYEHESIGILMESEPLHSRRLAVRRRLCSCCWPSDLRRCFTAVGDFIASITRAVSDITGWIFGGAISLFTSAYNSIVGFISSLRDLIFNWASKVREWILGKLREMGAGLGVRVTAALERLIRWLGRVVLDRVSMSSTARSAFLTEASSMPSRNA